MPFPRSLRTPSLAPFCRSRCVNRDRDEVPVLLFVLVCKLTQSCKIAFLTSFRPAFALGLFVLSLCHILPCSPNFPNGISLIRSCATGQSFVLIMSDKVQTSGL
jgi:hypothetical protein